jgi:hypothetical protein
MEEVNTSATATASPARATRPLLPRPALTSRDVLGSGHIRESRGFLTIGEVAERYGIAREHIEREVEAARVGSVTLQFRDGTEATFLPTKDRAVSAWLAALVQGVSA